MKSITIVTPSELVLQTKLVNHHMIRHIVYCIK